MACMARTPRMARWLTDYPDPTRFTWKKLVTYNLLKT